MTDQDFFLKKKRGPWTLFSSVGVLFQILLRPDCTLNWLFKSDLKTLWPGS